MCLGEDLSGLAGLKVINVLSGGLKMVRANLEMWL